MEPIMQLINTLNALNVTMQKLTEKMTSEYINTFEEICTESDPPKQPEPVQEEKPVDRSAVRAKLAELTRLGFSDEVKALLKKHGAERLSAVDDAEFPALMKEAEALGLSLIHI